MPRRIVSHGGKGRNSKGNTRKGVSKRVSFGKSNSRRNNKFHSFNIRNVDFSKFPVKRNTLIMGATVVVAGILGVGALNGIIQPEQEVEATDTVVLPERQLPGVSKAGHKYADDATEVMKKLQGYQYRNDGKKVVYLTFDDGPSESTNKILDILEKNDVRATFFVMGNSLERAGQSGKDVLKRSYEYGNAIANHSYSHDYSLLYPNKTLDFKAFKTDFEKTDKLLKEALGDKFETKVWRCPGGHMSWKGMDELQKHLDETGIASVDWNALNGDAVGKGKTADDLYQEVVKTSEGKEMVVVLMHDASSKEETVKSLQKTIDYYKKNGYEFRTLI